MCPLSLLDKEFESELKVVNTKPISKKPLVRSTTVKHSKPPIAAKIMTEPKIEVAERKPLKNKHHTIQRSLSLYRSTSSLNSTSKVTIPKPFSFETKDKAMLEHRLKIVSDDLVEKKRIASAFRANPMPISSPNLPEKVVQKTTVPISFQFESDQRINYHHEKNLLKSFADSSSMSSSNNISSSKIVDISYLNRSPFMPKPSTKPITIPETPTLTLKSRVQQRRGFDEHVRQKEQEALKVKEELEQQKKEEEQLEYEKLRSEKTIKASGICKYKELKIVHSNKVTVPRTPKFSDRFAK